MRISSTDGIEGGRVLYTIGISVLEQAQGRRCIRIGCGPHGN